MMTTINRRAMLAHSAAVFVPLVPVAALPAEDELHRLAARYDAFARATVAALKRDGGGDVGEIAEAWIDRMHAAARKVMTARATTRKGVEVKARVSDYLVGEFADVETWEVVDSLLADLRAAHS